MIADFHIHSKYSYDSILEPRKIVKLCKEKGYDTISITDHNTIKGSLEAKKYEREFGVEVLIGEEVLTDAGDIIGINLKNEIRSRCFPEVLDEIKKQGGISILPHPYKGHYLTDGLIRNIDVIEGLNSRTSEELNKKAVELGRTWNKPVVAGSDAHLAAEIGLARTGINTTKASNINDALLNGKIELACLPSRRYFIYYSQFIKLVKKSQYKEIPVNIWILAKRMIIRRFSNYISGIKARRK